MSKKAFDYLISEIYSIPTTSESYIDKIVKKAKEIKNSEGYEEISDEEIEKEAIKFSEDFLGINKMVSSMSFIYACKWYREQLKQRQ